MNMWDERYRAHETVYGTKPNVFWASQLGMLAPGSVALPCDGEGRNAVWAARQGWDVWSFDASEVGVQKSLELAEAHGVRIACEVGDAFAVEPGQQFDVVGLVFAHMPEPRRAEFHRRAWSWVKPGGHLIVEGFHKDQLGSTSGGPKDLAMLYAENTLPEDVLVTKGEGRLLWQARCEQVLDEGPFHQGRGITCQWVLQKADA